MSQLGPSFKSGMLLFVLALGLSAAVLYGGAVLVDVEKTAAAGSDDGEVVAGAPVNVTAPAAPAPNGKPADAPKEKPAAKPAVKS